MRHKIITKVFLVNESSEILCLKRSMTVVHNTGEWDLPGGKLDVGEPPALAAKREVLEETGLDAPSLDLIYANTKEIDDGTTIFLFFFSAVTGPQQIRLSDEHETYVWLKLDAVRTQADMPDFREALEFAANHHLLEIRT